MRKTFFVLAAVIISTQLYSQQDTTLLDEALITANKFSNKTSLTGKVVTVITAAQLERSGGKDLSQLLTEQSGLFITGANSNPGKDKSLYLRGSRVDHTLITIDGIPVYDPSGIGGNFDIRNLPISNIERIEILKGSQSTLYGSDAIAGVINIITKKASNKTFAGTVSTSYGSNNTARANAGIQGSKEKFSYNISYAFHDTKGINETINRSLQPVTDRDGFNQHSFRLGLGIKPTTRFQLQPFFAFTSIRGDIDQGAFTDELDYTYKQKSWQAGLRSELALGKAKLTILYGYNNIDRIYTDDSVKSRNGFDTWSEGVYEGDEHFGDVYITSPLGKEVKITGGVDLRSAESDQSYSSIGFFGPYKTEYSNDSLSQDQFGIYTALNWNHSSGFNAEAGSRINFHTAYGNYVVYNLNPSFLIKQKVKIFANLSSAYRTPSLYQLYSEYGNRKLKPEAAITFEAGVQYFSPGNKFTGRAVVFNRAIKDVIFFFYNPNTFSSQYINQDKQKDHGFELEATYQVDQNIAIKAFYNYVTGKIDTRVAGKDTTYNNLLRRPKSSAGINVSVQFKKNFFASTHLQYVGKRADAYFDNMLFTTVSTTLDNYFLWDLYAEYGFYKNRLKVFADLRNVTSSKYTEISGFNTLGFNGYGGVRFQF
jgi:vitamin B12 transporter